MTYRLTLVTVTGFFALTTGNAWADFIQPSGSMPATARPPVTRQVAAVQSVAAIRDAVNAHNNTDGAQMLREFREFLALPNISANQSDMLANAGWIEAYVAERGFTAETITAGRAPYVIAERLIDVDAPTVLVYAHFDGQPVQPENWASPPFTPTLKDGDTALDWDKALDGPIDAEWRVYARSAGDDKAPVIALMHAIDALESAQVPVTVNIKLILDGEEEAGSPTLEQILATHADRLDADVMLFCDGPMHQSRRRQLVFGVRGMATMHLTTYGPSRPLHSGHYGNWAPHPTDTLMRLLTTLKDETGAITVEGYTDTVRPVTEAETAAIAALPRVDDMLAEELALGRVEGDGKRLEELIMQPAIIVKGFDGGGVGSQSRNIIVPTAMASLNLRLVPDQAPEDVRAALEQHFRTQGFHVVHDDPSVQVRREHPNVLKVDWRGGYPAFRSSLDGSAARVLTGLLTELDGEPPLLSPTMGGSLPIYLFERALNDVPIIILPVANHDNNQHGRDENLRIQNLFDAVTAYAAVIARFRAQ
jgi:acetylornithine deacetylase/succinyl-diaminopimelate desuccinylase-like protein